MKNAVPIFGTFVEKSGGGVSSVLYSWCETDVFGFVSL